MFTTRLQEQLSARYLRKAPIAAERKREFLIAGGLMAPPFLSLFPAWGRYGNDLSLVPIWIFMVFGILWQLIFYWGHKVTSLPKFKEMSPDETETCLIYDSFWHYLMRSGFGLYTFTALMWGLIELGRGEGQLALVFILLFSCAAFVMLCLTRRDRIIVIAIDGLRKHKKIGEIAAVVMGFVAVLPILSGITRMVQVTMGQEAGSTAIIPFVLLAILILALTVFLMAFVGILITRAHYCRWKQQKTKRISGFG
jgi:hypothetical protein